MQYILIFNTHLKDKNIFPRIIAYSINRSTYIMCIYFTFVLLFNMLTDFHRYHITYVGFKNE